MHITNQKKELLKKINKNFPDILWKSAKYISSGFDNDIIILDNKIVFRFPKNNYSKKILNDEIALLAFLAKKVSTSLPNYTYITKNQSFGGYPLIKGFGLSKNILKKCTSQQRIKIALQLGKFLTELHTVPITKIKKFNPRIRSGKKELKQLSKDAKKYLYPTFSLKEKALFDSFFLELSQIFKKNKKNVLVHGDFSSEHIILNSDKNLEGIIDFTDKAIHNPAFDFIFLWEFGASFIKLVYKYYKGTDKERILELSNVYAQASAVWNMIQAKRKGKMNYTKWYRWFKNLRKMAF